MDFSKMGKKILMFLLQALFAVYEAETSLLFRLIAEAEAKGLKGEDARKEVLRRFRENFKEEIKDSLLNFLLEAVVLSTKGQGAHRG